MGRCMQTLNRKACEGQRSSVAGSGRCPSTCVFGSERNTRAEIRMNAGKTAKCLQFKIEDEGLRFVILVLQWSF